MATALKNVLGKCCVDWIATNGQRHRRTVPCDCARVKRGKACAVAKAEAKLMTREIAAQKKERGTVHVADTGQVIDAWLATKTLIAAASFARYQTAARHWQRVLIGQQGVRRFYALTKQNVEEYVNTRLREGAHEKTVHCELVALRQLCEWACEEEQGYHDKNVARKVAGPPLPETENYELTLDEEMKIIEAVKGHPTDTLMFTLAFRAGLRRGGVATLRVRDVHLETNPPQLQAEEKGRHTRFGKQKKKMRIVPIDAMLERALRACPPVGQGMRDEGGRMKEEAGEYWFGPMGKGDLDAMSRRLCGIVRRVTGKAGLAARFHNARHTFGTQLRREGVDLKTRARLMGHSSTRTTERYDSVVTEDLAAAVAKLPALPSVSSGLRTTRAAAPACV